MNFVRGSCAILAQEEFAFEQGLHCMVSTLPPLVDKTIDLVEKIYKLVPAYLSSKVGYSIPLPSPIP
jgi:hypothetical protein